MKTYQLIVIGGGPAGLAAASAAWEAGVRSILIVERDRHLGGILNQCIHNGFGLHYFGEALSGPEYAGRFIDRLAQTGVEVLTDTTVLSITKEHEVYVTNTRGCSVLRGESLILAMGCRERARGAVGIPGTRPAGIFTAGTAQQYINLLGYSVGRRIVIRGTGDVGLIMARRMTLEGAKVLACIGAGSHAEGLARNVQQCLLDFDIPLLLNHTVTEVRGKDRVEQVVAMRTDARRNTVPGTEIVFDCDTLLLSIGLIPENELTRGAGIPIDRRTNGAVVYENGETEAPGIFACGNVLQVHDLVDYVTTESLRAGRAAAEHVLRGEVPAGETLSLAPGANVKYTVPMKARKNNIGEALEISFRVTRVFEAGAAVRVMQGERQVARFKRPYLSASGMEEIRLPAALLRGLSPEDGPLTVIAEEEAD
jgi:NADPH-dependent 2,4-dienoyl-CoA reductase/sulfur reductase-like enzyme